jgi:hypothetical protein
MTNDQDREFARKQAYRIYENHRRKGGGGCDANHIATNIDYKEALRRGLLAECAYVHEFGGKIDTSISDYGDGGRDFLLPLYIDGERRTFVVNIKAKSVRVSFHGMVRVGTHLRVPVHEIKPQTIYIFAIYREQTDDAEILRWDWGQSLIDLNQRAVYENGNDRECYTKLFQDLRDLQELKDRMRPLEPLQRLIDQYGTGANMMYEYGNETRESMKERGFL